MGFTIEDMLVISKDKYKMEIIAGENGWSNSISWILLMEDSKVLKNFKGKDLAVTTGIGFNTTEELLHLVEKLVNVHAAGLVVNLGPYIAEIPDEVVQFSNDKGFPLLTVPWSTPIYDMIKDLSLRVLLQTATDEQIAAALIQAIENPDALGLYEKDLLPYFDIDGTFQVVLITNGELDIMDTVERRRLSYQLQIYMENVTHNAHFFYYDACFVLIMNDMSKSDADEVLRGFVKRLNRRMETEHVAVGVGSIVTDIMNLRLSYLRARAAVMQALKRKAQMVYFDDMGIQRLFALMPDKVLLKEMGEDVLEPLLRYDEEHDANYVETLYVYLSCNGSVQHAAEQLFTHRNTVIYRIGNIKKLLGTDLDSAQERLKYHIACMIQRC